MDSSSIPGFLQGTFLRYELGYFYSEPPPANLLSRDALASPNPWIVLAAVLERAKVGDFSGVTQVEAVFGSTQNPFVAAACLQLLGDIGTQDAVRFLLSLMGDDSSVVVREACQAAHHVGYLWLAPFMLRAWDHIDSHDERDLITLILSGMLEEGRGPIGEAQPFGSESSVEEHHQRVLTRLDQLRTRFGTENVPVWRGKVFSVGGLARDMHQLLLEGQKTGRPLTGTFLDLREKFEASTGINCSAFYEGRRFQPLATRALLEEFLGSDEGAKFEEGVRYFFGNPISSVRRESIP